MSVELAEFAREVIPLVVGLVLIPVALATRHVWLFVVAAACIIAYGVVTVDLNTTVRVLIILLGAGVGSMVWTNAK